MVWYLQLWATIYEGLEKIWVWTPALLSSTVVTLELTIASVTTALVLGVFLALGKISRNRVVKSVTSAYVFFFRGTPLMMQLFFVYYAFPRMLMELVNNTVALQTGGSWAWLGTFFIEGPLSMENRFFAAYLAFSLNIAAYLAEIIRAAIQSIPKGQMEAAKSLGLSYHQGMALIVLPQSYRRMIPPVCNEFVMVLKDTSLVSTISLMDLTFQTSMIATNQVSTLVYLPAMVIYLIMSAALTILFNGLEKKLSKYD
ncbi:MAG: amino acid ABC transporter permease [Oscillospiraceae bacterium]|jgi:polar amino acid transport system permease protein|nr:amino acid ABC transporter permease [Oscillospiraceae bacterium]